MPGLSAPGCADASSPGPSALACPALLSPRPQPPQPQTRPLGPPCHSIPVMFAQSSPGRQAPAQRRFRHVFKAVSAALRVARHPIRRHYALPHTPTAPLPGPGGPPPPQPTEPGPGGPPKRARPCPRSAPAGRSRTAERPNWSNQFNLVKPIQTGQASPIWSHQSELVKPMQSKRAAVPRRGNSKNGGGGGGGGGGCAGPRPTRGTAAAAASRCGRCC